MTWFAVDDSFHAHPKIAKLESGKYFAEAVALWTLAGSWCASQLTDGRVPAHQLRRLAPFKTREAAAELVRVGLWVEREEGYEFRDWDDYQPSKDEVESRRKKSANRSRKYRNKFKLDSDVTRDAERDATRDVGVSDATPVPSPSTPNGVHAAPSPLPTSVNAMTASLDPATSRVVEAYRDGIGDATGKRTPVAHAGRFAQAAELLAALDGTEADKLGTIRRAAAVAAKDPDHRKANVPFAWFARNVGRYSGQAETPDTEAIRAKLRKLTEDEHGARMRFDHDLGDKLQSEANVLRRQLAGVS